jgi:hypothetical protein
VDRVELVYETGVDRQRRWRNAGTQSAHLSQVEFGRLADGRWYAWPTGRWAGLDIHAGAYVFAATERGRDLALRLAYRWMRDAGGTWWPTPAAFDSHHRPVDGLPWKALGGEWYLLE